MAKFKVGDRVRKIGNLTGDFRAIHLIEIPIGAEGTIIGRSWGVDAEDGFEWLVKYDKYGSVGQNYGAASSMLAPLTDPNAEWATEQVRKLFKMPVAA